jgi:hypothetical protein
MQRIVITTLLAALSHTVVALEPECDPLIKASEARLAQSAWHSVTEDEEVRVEAMKVAGQFYMQLEGEWQPMPMDLDAAEKIIIGQMQDGTIKVSECQMLASEVVDGREMNVISYRSEIVGAGMPATTAKLYIGKNDGLPYKMIDSDGSTQVTHVYENLAAPAL